MKNINKIVLPIICSTALLAGCSKRQKISIEVANEFCLKNYKAITKECSQASVNYNLHLKFNDEGDAANYSKLIVCWYSLYLDANHIPNNLIKINGKDVTINGTDNHINDDAKGMESHNEFLVYSLGVRIKLGDNVNSYIYKYTESYFQKCDIYVANSNNIVINGTVKMGYSENNGLQPVFLPNGEDSFDSDGCYEKSTLKLTKGTEIKNSGDNIIFTVSENSSVTAKYTYF